MNFLNTIILLAIFPFFEMNKYHESYISVCEINLSEERKIMEISMEITAHDIVYLFENEKIGLLKPFFKDDKEYFIDSILKKYIDQHFIILHKENKIDLTLIGNEISLDGILMVYMESKMKKPLTSIEIKNDLLISSFPNQQNIVNLKGSIKSSYTFNQYETKHVFQ
tara:strand:- start:1934 stop:2434 length:501 start_codon:yes stop_codon:yes gene_type:complete